MNKETIYIGSVNKAMRAKDILRQNGIKSGVEAEGEHYAKHGCGFGVSVMHEDYENAKLLLEKYGFKIKKDD